MQSAFDSTPPPALLLPGTVVGGWRVVAWAGRGVHGAVYRAVPVDVADAPPVALKLAVFPKDPRFPREVELLSRTRHPSVPRLVESGTWQDSDGSSYPYVAMEWVEGVPLYEWVREWPLTSQQVLEMLAQLAGALAALHSYGAIHRDVKGGNVLVRLADGRAMLTDFGTGLFPGTATLTPPTVQPGTPAYRSPEAMLFEVRFFRDETARYLAGPADDVYALGVTACRLVTGEYPDFAVPWRDEQGTWHLDAVLPPASLRRVEPRLRDLILRMLSVRPEQRGTAAQLAEALEQAARSSPERRLPVPVEVPAEAQAPVPKESAPARPRESVRPWLSAAAVFLALTAWVSWLASDEPVEEPGASRVEVLEAGPQDAGTAGLGEAAAATSMEEAPDSPVPQMMTEEALPEPLPGQAVPDAKGRCPHKQQVALNGGCWVLEVRGLEECEALSGQLIKGTCYIPILPRGRTRVPTSGPTEKSAP
ncbi:serine/threonine protein kinase [Hyalangium gracile]|uniref:serine/threonine protein kinase n=1 Tax=Hyalangium gracile TaxID=394092 RepID=UPI001CC9F024|nr:serine/threonine protein kinase [Hyalangium gracile]